METKPVRLVKFLRFDGSGPFKRSYKYNLVGWNIITKRSSIQRKKSRLIQCCVNGLHSATYEGINKWFSHYYGFEDIRAFIVEVEGIADIDDAYVNGKIAVEKMRLIKEIDINDISTYIGQLSRIRSVARKFNVLGSSGDIKGEIDSHFCKVNQSTYRVKYVSHNK